MNKVFASMKTTFGKLNEAFKQPRGKVDGVTPSRGWFFRFPLEEQILFAKRLSILLKAGMPTLEALRMMQTQTVKPGSRKVIQHLFLGVQQGQTLYSRMESFHKYFGDFAVNIVRVGEMSGSLNDNLTFLVRELKKKRELQRKIIGALIYPAIIVVATFGIALLLIVSVFPKIIPILQGFKGTLPVTTRSFIFTSHLLATKGWLILIVLCLCAVVVWFLVRRFVGMRRLLHRQLLRLPILGNLFQNYYMANMCRTFGILLKSEVPIVETARITADTATNLAYKFSLSALPAHITKGSSLSDFFIQQADLYPAMITQMVRVGESAGSLSDSLLYLADVYEAEVDETTKNLSTSVEPVLMVFMGVLVGFIALSIITPIYSITQNLSR